MSRVTLNEESQSRWIADGAEARRYEYPLTKDDLVIDLGAYRGEWASEIWDRYKCQIIVVDPGPWIVGFPHGEVINKAAGIGNAKVQFGGQFYYTSSFEEPTHEFETFDINALVSSFDEVALCKINVEGMEYDILPRLIEDGLHKRIRNLQVQFHLIEGLPVDKWYLDIASKLSETHRLDWQYPFCWESWRRK